MKFNITEADLEDINACFTNYIFYKRHPNGDIECWCTHCNEHFTIPFYERIKTQLEINLYSQAAHNEKVVCPHCKATAIAKQIGKAKGCKNLAEEQRIVLVKKINYNCVIAQSFHCYKEYSRRYYLPSPRIYEFRKYEFTPNNASCWEKRYYYDEWSTFSKPVEPFRIKSSMGYYIADNTYNVIGLNELEDSFLKYNQLDDFCKLLYKEHNYTEFQPPIMKYLCYFSIYPQIEMLQKLGYTSIVNDLVFFGIKNWPFVDWKAKKINDFFKMTKEEYKEFHNLGTGYEILSFLKVRHWLKKNKQNYDVKTVNKYFRITGNYENLKRAESIFLELKEPVIPGIEYLMTQYKKYGNGGFGNFALYFADYRNMAKEYKLGNSDEVKYPPKLVAAHNRAVAVQNAVLAEKKAKEEKKLMKKYKLTHEKNVKRYSFSSDGFVIIVPSSSREIIEEGINIKHCVGGYADRHLRGVLTILFLRKQSNQNKSLYTIEMHDKRLVQVQGYGNKTPLTKEAKAFFDKWLEWVKDGSPRKEDGSPILKIKKNMSA